jgi:hypothetical protein
LPIPTKLDYIGGSHIVPSGTFCISPSALHTFFSKPTEWYRKHFLGEEPFTGSTKTYLGTIVHFVAQSYVLSQTLDKSEVYKYLYSELCPNSPPPDFTNESACISHIRMHSTKPDIDIEYIAEQYKPMGNALIQHIRSRGLPQHVEKLLGTQVTPSCWVAGSIDAIHNTTVIDYKTTSDLTPKDAIPYNYKLQLLAYAYICKANNIPIDRISIVWITNHTVGRISDKTGKPMKDYPATVHQVTEIISQEDLDFIESLLNLVSDSVDYVNANPDTAYLLFKDYRLKPQHKGS